MADILKSAQAQIDDAAAQIGTPAGASPPTDPNPPLLKEEALLSEEALKKTQPDQPTQPEPIGLDLPFSSRGQNDPTDDKKADLPPESEQMSVVPPPVAKKRSGSKSLIFAVLLFLVATLPLAVYFTSQQRQLADLRGKAQEGPYPANYLLCLKNASREECEPLLHPPGTTPKPNGYNCNSGGECSSGYCDGPKGVCWPNPNATGTIAPKQTPAVPSVAPTGGPTPTPDYVNFDYITFSCGRCGADQRCETGIGTDPNFSFGSNPGACNQVDRRSKGSSGNWEAVSLCNSSCSGGTTTPNPPPGTGSPNPTSPPVTGTLTPTPTSTPIPGGTCELIKVYDAAGTEITQAIKDGTKKLAIGEQITIATTKGNATKAHFRIQGIADWAENDP
ncbi:hypothetical protein HY087_00660, partial [Candidatus Gottesmanbacteria bacterium]|nr:hypothetical protein [Candidatus Gottesmanbacteria bacterium]